MTKLFQKRLREPRRRGMSAGKDAVPMKDECANYPNAGGLLWRVACQDEDCQWVGVVGELLVEPDNSTMYCPQCRTANWIYGGRSDD